MRNCNTTCNLASRLRRKTLGTAENKQLLQHIYEEIAKRNIQPLLDSMADDIQWTIIGTSVLSGVTHSKREAIEKILKPLAEKLTDDPFIFKFGRLIAEGEYVVMEARGWIKTKSGKPYNNTYCFVCRIVDGKIKEMTDYIDTEVMTYALGE